MLSERPLEYCFICDEPTGRAGQGDGSLYCECDKGPFCEECWEKHHNADVEVAQLEAENARLREYVREVRGGPHHTAIDAVKCPDLVEWVYRVIDGASDLLYDESVDEDLD